MKSSTRKGNHRSAYNLAKDFAIIKEALADTSGDLRGRALEILAHSMKDMKAKSIDLKENLADYVSDKPYKSVGIALFTGVLFGLFLRRK